MTYPWRRTFLEEDSSSEEGTRLMQKTATDGLLAIDNLARLASADPSSYARMVRDMRRKQSRAQLFLRLCEHPDKQPKTSTTFSPFPDAEFSILLAKLPWAKRGSNTVSRKCLSIHDLAQLRLQSISATNAVLCLWTTLERLQDTILLGEWWGFDYVGVLFICIQLVPNSYTAYQGTASHWTRDNAELILLFTRGTNVQACVRDKHISQLVFCDANGDDDGALQNALDKACNVVAHRDSVARHVREPCTALFFHPRMASSQRRPKHIYAIMERLFEDFPRCELFATHTRIGWATWGCSIHYGPVPPFAHQLAQEEDAAIRARIASHPQAVRETTTRTMLAHTESVDEIMRKRSKPGPKSKKGTAKRKRKGSTKTPVRKKKQKYDNIQTTNVRGTDTHSMINK